MNWIEAIEQLKNGKAITRPGWENAYIQATKTEDGAFQIFAAGENLKPEMLVLMSGDFSVKDET